MSQLDIFTPAAPPRDPRRDPLERDTFVDGSWTYTVVSAGIDERGRRVVMWEARWSFAGEERKGTVREGLGAWRSRWGTLGGPR